MSACLTRKGIPSGSGPGWLPSTWKWFDDWSDDVRDWARLTREAAEQIDAPPGKQAVEIPSWMQWKPGFNQSYFFSAWSSMCPVSRRPRRWSAVVACYETLARSTNARVRLCRGGRQG